jgi:hypothetical protein
VLDYLLTRSGWPRLRFFCHRNVGRNAIKEMQHEPIIAAQLGHLVDGSSPQQRRARDVLIRCLDASVSSTFETCTREDAVTSSPNSLDETRELPDSPATSCSSAASPVLLGPTLIADWCAHTNVLSLSDYDTCTIALLSCL